MQNNSTIRYLYSSNNHSLGSNISETIFQQIWLAIVEGELAHGSLVTEESLAQEFDVSRTPLREAVQRLIGIGLIDRSRGRSMNIFEPSIRAMENLTFTRERLEGLVGWHVWERAQQNIVSLDELYALHERHKRLATTKDPLLMLELGLQFHQILRNSCGNEVVVVLLEQVLLALEPYRRLVETHTERCDDIIEEHERVLQLLAGSDGPAVELAMRQHIAEAREFYRSCLSELLQEKPRSA
tara:strand:+ start:854 stop:1576 length:723 start_codon:yes stop_codon:yes gene_type:complete